MAARSTHAADAVRRRRSFHPASLAVVAFVVLVTAWNAGQAGEHLLTDRDPGVYVTAARWLAEEGTLLVDPAVGPFADQAFSNQTGLRFDEQGWHVVDDGRLEPQFLHLLPVLLAVAHVVGGDRLLLAAPAIIAGAALLAFHAYARRLLRPWWAVLATVALGVDLVWVHASRDAFSEVPAVALLFAGLAVLWDARTRGSTGRAVVAGVLLGAVATTRVEGFVALVPLLGYVAVELILAEGDAGVERRRTRAAMVALLAGASVTVALAVADLVLFSTWYLDDLGGLLAAVAAAVVVTAVGAAVAVALRRRGTVRSQQGRPPQGTLRSAGTFRSAVHSRWAVLGATAVVVVAGGLWFLRPLVSTVTGAPSAAIAALELQEGRDPEGLRRYSEQSVVWLSWYLGPAALAAGFAGLALAVHRLLRHRRPDLRPLPFLAVFATVSLLYLWRPSIVPDQIWAMRRYLLVTIPGLVLFGAMAGQALQDRLAATAGTFARAATFAAVVVFVAATVGFPVATVVPVAGTTTQAGALGGVTRVCGAVGENGAVVVVPGDALELISAQSLRSFCGVPVAVAEREFERADVERLAAAWAEAGRALHLVGADAARVGVLAGRAPELTVVVDNDELLEPTLTSRPDELVARPFTFVVSDASPAGGP